MKTEIAKKWVTALRSGEYNQGYTRVRNGDSFCCLGVLCDLFEKETQQTIHVRHNETFLYGEGGDCFYLPDEVQEWSGISSGRGAVYGFSEEHGHTHKVELFCLSAMNDKSIPFDVIADKIEENSEIL